jgi:microcystin-dependent protein
MNKPKEGPVMCALLGEVRFFPYGKIPVGWLACTGQILNITEYPKLYMLIGTKFGGDGKQNFRLPDLQKESPENMMYCIAVEGDFPDIW